MFEFLKKLKRRKDISMGCVYAGPEQMTRRNKKPLKKDDQDRQEKPAEIRRDDAVMECVYAGPEEMGVEPVYAEPEKAEKKPVCAAPVNVEIEDVYGGPGMMGELDYDAPEEDEEEEQASLGEAPDSLFSGVYAGPKIPDSPMMAVYAGPQMKFSIEAIPPAKPNDSSMMFVYAGPDYFSNKKGQGIQPVQKPEDSADNEAPYPQNYAVGESEEPISSVSVSFCPNCGRKVTPDMKNCECGWTLKEEEQPEDGGQKDSAPKGPKDVSHEDPPMAPVYAGPEYWNRRTV